MDLRNLQDFMSAQTCASICCTGPDEHPYCFSCFYAFHPGKGILIYKSAPEAHHSQLLAAHPRVAGTILPDALSKLHIQGIQFEGSLLPEEDPACRDAAAIYYRRHPLAVAHPGKLWTIRLEHIKFTDSKLGFGKKLEWKREAALENN